MTTNSLRSGLAGALVQGWVWLYTLGLPSRSRLRRQEEIASDLWEHHHDRLQDGRAPALISLEALERALTGAAADILWRFQLEGPQMVFNLPLRRVGGACLLALVAAAMLNTAANGYSSAVDGFDGELRRLAEVSDWEAGVYTALQLLAGVSMLLGACLLYLYMASFAKTRALLASAALAGAGLVAVITSATYFVTSELADEYVLAPADTAGSVLATARAFMLLLGALTPSSLVLLAIAVLGFAAVAGRHGLVPRWVGFVALGGASMIPALVVSEIAGQETLSWMFLILGFFLLVAWLAVAGGWLLLGGSSAGSGSVLEHANASNATAPQN